MPPPLQTLLAGMHKPPESEESEGGEDGEGGEHATQAQVMAMEEFLDAVHGRDARSAADALCDFIELYESSPHEESGEPPS